MEIFAMTRSSWQRKRKFFQVFVKFFQGRQKINEWSCTLSILISHLSHFAVEEGGKKCDRGSLLHSQI